ncbi:hypothetical protein BS47DRAFT_984332 [Hydnum rufescens UP504]|uniref:RNI-like protein n=1 Tax=Hydnum rufescens UP504 TaxID=1448309 RepID=A0A9P6AW80_9AGAM|nr:hypothetical protein BS47DRAFT_984332 [Hydnum rufescens UP504]
MITRVPRSSVASSILTLDLMENGLSHIDGAQQVIDYLLMKPRIKKLNLSRNEIGDYGSIALFEFLCSPRGRKVELTELNLNQNAIGMAGLRAISAYIRGNPTLQELNIQNNDLTGRVDVISDFTSSLNKSHVSRLVLSGNTSLGDTFAEEFFTQLTSPHLRSVDISLIGLTPASGPFIISYLTSDRALRLREIGCNGNALGLEAVRESRVAYEMAISPFKSSNSMLPLEL